MNRAIVTVTDAAKDYINSLCLDGMSFVSVRINNNGCSGHSYEYGLVNKHDIQKFDETFTWIGGGLVIDAASVMHLLGSTLDLKTTIMESYLHWKNPQVIDTCGCGVSFTLTE